MRLANGEPRLTDPVRFPMWGHDEWHDFLVLSEAYARQPDATQPFERVIRLRDIIAEEIPDTVTTFRLSAHLPDDDARKLSEELLALCGTWRVPEPLAGGYAGRRVVNPNNSHAHLYSDATAVCECGRPIRRLGNMNAAADHLPGRDSHAEECTVEMRERARAQHIENRRRIFTQMAHLACTPRAIKRRLGYPLENDDLGRAMAAVGIENHTDYYREGRRRMIRTMLVLLRVYTPADIAPIYGLQRHGVLKLLQAEAAPDTRTLYHCRRRATSSNFEYPRGYVAKPSRGHPTTARADGGTDE